MKKHKIRTILRLALAAAAIWLAVQVGLQAWDVSRFEGSEVKMHDEYQLQFVQMNKTDEHMMPVKTGDELAVAFNIEQGTVDLTISMGDTILYRGNKIDAGSFTLPVEAEGNCRVEVRASQARGEVSVLVKPME